MNEHDTDRVARIDLKGKSLSELIEINDRIIAKEDEYTDDIDKLVLEKKYYEDEIRQLRTEVHSLDGLTADYIKNVDGRISGLVDRISGIDESLQLQLAEIRQDISKLADAIKRVGSRQKVADARVSIRLGMGTDDDFKTLKTAGIEPPASIFEPTKSPEAASLLRTIFRGR